MIKLLKLDYNEDRIFGLDLLRMLAVTFVIASHSNSIVGENVFNFFNLFYFDGVCIFFVLSGFLIGGILIKTIEKNGFNKIELLNFWIRRWLRTLPNYYLFLLILAILSKIYVIGFPLRGVIPSLFFTQNLTRPNSFYGESWSLSIEEWFYVSVPLLVLIGIKVFKIGFKRSILLISLFFFAFSTFLRYYLYSIGYTIEMGDYRRVVIMRMDNLMYGVIASYVCFYHQKFWLKYKYFTLIMGITLLLIWKYYSEKFPIESFYYVNIYYPLICTAVMLTLPFLNNLKIKKHNIITKIITYISLISYSLFTYQKINNWYHSN